MCTCVCEHTRKCVCIHVQVYVLSMYMRIHNVCVCGVCE